MKDKYRISFYQTLSVCHKQSQINTDILIDIDILLEGHFQGLFKNDYPYLRSLMKIFSPVLCKDGGSSKTKI